MAISLAKTLQTVSYTLYITTELLFVDVTMVASKQLGYQSSGHHSDNFMPMLQRTEVVTDAAILSVVLPMYISNPSGAIAAYETWLVGNVGYYSGGSVV